MDLNRNPSRALLPFAVYLLLVAGVCLTNRGAPTVVFAAVVTVHAVFAALLLRFANQAPSPVAGRWRLALPYVLWLACWLELGWLIRSSGLSMNDAQIAAVDLAVFGGHGHLLFARWLPEADQVMHLIYLSYYGLVLGPPLVLVLQRRAADCDRYTSVVMATYLLCFLAYLVYPVLGPRAATAAQVATGHGGGSLGALAEALRQAGDSLGTAFPSSHCAGALAAALAAGKLFSRRTRFVLLVWAGLITLSTIYTGNHYSIDAVAGVLVAVGVRLAADQICRARAAIPKEALS